MDNLDYNNKNENETKNIIDIEDYIENIKRDTFYADYLEISKTIL